MSTSASRSREELETPFQLHDRVPARAAIRDDRARRIRDEPTRPIFRIGGSIIQQTEPDGITSVSTSAVPRPTPAAEITPGIDAASDRNLKR